MTYLQPSPHRSHILNFVIVALAAASLVGIFALVGLYNNIVDLNHNLAAAKSQLDAIGAKSTTLNQQVIADLGNVSTGNLAAQDGLIQDNQPAYFPLDHYFPTTQWPLASQ